MSRWEAYDAARGLTNTVDDEAALHGCEATAARREHDADVRRDET